MSLETVFEGMATTEKAELAVEAVRDALFDTLGPVPLVVALGVLEVTKLKIIEDAERGLP